MLVCKSRWWSGYITERMFLLQFLTRACLPEAIVNVCVCGWLVLFGTFGPQNERMLFTWHFFVHI